MKGHVVFPAPNLKEIVDNIGMGRTGWNPDAISKVDVRIVEGYNSFTVLPNEAFPSMTYWLKGEKVVVPGGLNAVMGTPPNVGKHYLYIDDSKLLVSTQTPWNLARTDIVFVGVAYWNTRSLYTGWHCHSWNYPADLRAVARPQITSGLAVTINVVEDHKLDVADGVLKFADIEAPIRGNSTGYEIFQQKLRALEARRLWAISGIWYDDTASNLVAKLDGLNNVQYCDAVAGLQSMSDGEYTAVWLVATLCNHRPVKIVLGSSKGATAEEAKALNTPESFNELQFGDCAEVYHVMSRVIVKDIAEAPWYELVEIDDTVRDDPAFDPGPEKGDPGEPGEPGASVELRENAGWVEWRQIGTETWLQLFEIPSDGEPGTPGSSVELRENAGWVEWRQVGSETWLQLFEVPKDGEQGPPGTGVEPANVIQEDHGFSVNQAIRHNGTIYVLALADNDTNAQVCGIVSEVVDVNTFKYVTDGFISGGWVAGSEYFLSPDTPGLLITLSDPEIWSIGQVRISLGWGTSQGLKVEIDVGDLIEELPTVRLVGVWDRETEFCINQGISESLTVDYYAVFPYEIVQLIAGVNEGSLPGSAIEINGVPVTGLSDITIAAKQVFTASALNLVEEGDEVTLRTSGDFTGNPAVVKIKLKILRE